MTNQSKESCYFHSDRQGAVPLIQLFSMKNYLFVAVLLICSATTLWAQNRELRLKISANYLFANTTPDPATGASLITNQLTAPKLSLMVPTRAGDFHEFTLGRATLAHPVVPGSGTGASGSGSFGYMYKLTTRNHWDKVKLYMGLGIETALFGRRAVGALGQGTSLNVFGLSSNLLVAPGVMYDLSDRYFLDFSMPIAVYSLDYHWRSEMDAAGNTTITRGSDASAPLFKRGIPLELGFGIRF